MTSYLVLAVKMASNADTSDAVKSLSLTHSLTYLLTQSVTQSLTHHSETTRATAWTTPTTMFAIATGTTTSSAPMKCGEYGC